MINEAFLQAFHKRHPGCTSRALARARTENGGSSYDVLARCVRPSDPTRSGRVPVHVLDLGCGDGYLLERLLAGGWSPDRACGVDVSSDELALAHKRPSVRTCTLVRARAQSLPLADASVGVVLSHLAFMLMSDPDAVVAEIARVLVPGGVFAAVIGGGPKVGDGFEMFLDVLQPMIRERPAIPQLVDPRLRSDIGIAEVFQPLAGARVAIDDFYVHLDAPFEPLWASLSVVYEMHALDAPDTETLKRRFRAQVSSIEQSDGIIPCTMAMRLLQCSKS